MTQKTIIRRTGIKRILHAFLHTFNGLKWLIKNEAAFQQEVVLFIPLCTLALWLDITLMNKAVLIVSMLFVLFAEMVNTAIEAVVDRIGLEYHELSGVAKNIGSAIVLLSFLMSGIFWGIILWEL